MVEVTEVAICSEINTKHINTKHINTVWAERKLLNLKPFGGSRNQ
jgi:hypothetical protein